MRILENRTGRRIIISIFFALLLIFIPSDFAIAQQTNGLKIIDVEDVAGVHPTIYKLSVSNNGKYIAIATMDDSPSLLLFDKTSGFLWKVPNDCTDVTMANLGVLNDGTVVLSCYPDWTKIYNAEGKVIRNLNFGGEVGIINGYSNGGFEEEIVYILTSQTLYRILPNGNIINKVLLGGNSYYPSLRVYSSQDRPYPGEALGFIVSRNNSYKYVLYSGPTSNAQTGFNVKWEFPLSLNHPVFDTAVWEYGFVLADRGQVLVGVAPSHVYRIELNSSPMQIDIAANGETIAVKTLQRLYSYKFSRSSGHITQIFEHSLTGSIHPGYDGRKNTFLLDDYLVIADNGRILIFNSTDGQLLWKKDMFGGIIGKEYGAKGGETIAFFNGKKLYILSPKILLESGYNPSSRTSTSITISHSSAEGLSQTEYGRTSGGLNPAYLIAAFIGLVLIGGVAAKAKGGKSKPSPSQEVTAKPAPAPAKKPEPAKPQKTVPYFPAELLDKYEPLEFLGEGGFAKVFKVKRKSDGKIIALKVSRLDEKAKKFFLKEVRAWRLLDHPNIVKLYNAFDEPLPHLEIEFVDGIKLNDEVIRDLGKHPKPVDEKKAIHFIRGIAEGLKHAHSKQVFHRDLKPQNVLITSDLTPKITDWGLAKVGAISTTATTTKGLTLLYAAPEQLDDETYGHTDNRTDIYQLGLILYELLTGKLPYQGTSPAVVMAKVINPDIKPKPPSHFNKALAKYDGIFEKLLAKRKEERYQSVEEFLSDLNLLKKLDEERRELEKTIEKTKTTMSMTTDSKELRKLKRQVVEQLSRLALIHAQLNDKAELINALEDLKAFTKEHKGEIENAISQFELMLRESIPISRLTLDELKVLLHKVQREAEG